ncbi:hypothetical protein BD311DRAFT_776108 [Dichomitus squalens]|uniref:Uncharacterized protein n=1 Tax=Dichomitus squalens TaxID=114155 RepID=A0A4Q9MU22_9APHY|nr:hypothetical protein BD311DRAFT_776108 [Dichomitus squalens]
MAGMDADRAAVPQPTANAAATPPSSVPTPDTIKTLLESNQLQWQQISSAVAAATSAVPKASGQGAGFGGDLSIEEKNKIWSSRIELLAAATRIHNDCRSMETDIRDYKQLVESFSYQTLPAEDRTVIEGHLQSLQGQLGQKADDMKKILTNLSSAKFWPIYTNRRTLPPGLDGNSKEHQQELAKEIGSLKGSVSQLQDLFKSVDARWEQMSKQLQSNLSSESRATGGGDVEMASNQASTFLAEAIVPSELEKIRDTMANFEERLGRLERDVQDPSLLAQIDAIIAENVQSIVLASTGTVQAKPPEPRAALTEEQLKTLQTLQQHAATTGQQVARLSQEVAQLAGFNERLQTENMALQAENVQLRQQLEELQNTQTSSGDSTQADRMISEMRALNAAVRAYISQGSSSQSAEPMGDAVVKQIAPYLVKSIPELIAPQLQGLRDQQETLRAAHTQAIQELSTKMSSTLQAIEAIRVLVGGLEVKSPPPPSHPTVNGAS